MCSMPFCRLHSPLENTPHKATVIRDGRGVAALQTSVPVTTERRRATALDGGEHLEVQPVEPFPAALVKLVPAARINRPPPGVAAPSTFAPVEWARAMFQRIGRGPQFALGQVEIDHGVARILVAEQDLDRAQLGSIVEQVVAKQWRSVCGWTGFGDAAACGRLDGRRARLLCRYWCMACGCVAGGKHPHAVSVPTAVVLAQLLEQIRAEHDIAVLRPFRAERGGSCGPSRRL